MKNEAIGIVIYDFCNTEGDFFSTNSGASDCMKQMPHYNV